MSADLLERERVAAAQPQRRLPVVLISVVSSLVTAVCVLSVAVLVLRPAAPVAPRVTPTPTVSVSASTGPHSSNGALIYACSAQPCQDNQEFTIFDKNGAPIYSVGEYGGDAVFGDNRSVYPPNSVFDPAITESWESPAAYDRTFGLPLSCVAPHLWIAPQAFWVCRSGAWVRKSL